MIDFTHIKYGIVLALIAILFGGSLGLSFGCCEESIKRTLNQDAQAVFKEKYEGDQKLVDKVVNQSWVYLKRAHFHSQTMGVISIAFSILVSWLGLPGMLQFTVSTLSGFGSLGYGFFWLLSGFMAPALGSTGAAKHSVELVAQVSAVSFFVAVVVTFVLVIHKMFIQRGSRKETA